MRLCLFFVVAVAMAAVAIDADAEAPVGRGDLGGGPRVPGLGGA